MRKSTLAICSSLVSLNLAVAAQAENIEKNTARMQAMDKITGRVSMINVPVNGEVKFGSLSIVVRSCQTRPAEETPDNFAFVDITDTSPKEETLNIFKGWMISSSPATYALEHPIYDVWLLQCVDEENKDATMLTEEQLAERDTVPMQQLPPLKTAQTEGELLTTEDKVESEQKPIAEMTEEAKPEVSEPEMLLSTEFSFDEDEETPAQSTEDEDTSAEELPADITSAPNDTADTTEDSATVVIEDVEL